MFSKLVPQGQPKFADPAILLDFIVTLRKLSWLKAEKTSKHKKVRISGILIKGDLLL